MDAVCFALEANKPSTTCQLIHLPALYFRVEVYEFCVWQFAVSVHVTLVKESLRLSLREAQHHVQYAVSLITSDETVAISVETLESF